MPQNKITEPCNGDLEILSVEEERLVELIIEGKVTQKDAYRIAYGAENYGENALAVKASRKIASEKIQAHLRAIRSVGLAKIGLTREDRVRERLAFAARAEAAGNFGAANGAHDAVDKMLGHMVDRVMEVAEDPMVTLQIIAAYSPEFAAHIAATNNIPWSPTDHATKH